MARGTNRLMLLGSPPDMVHSVPPHRTSRRMTKMKFCTLIIIYLVVKCKRFIHDYICKYADDVI